MIRHRISGQARRIAVVEVPRSAINRLGRVGRVGSIRPLNHLGSIRDWDWTLVPSIVPMTVMPYLPAQPTDANGNVITTPPTEQSWMAAILSRQANQRESTPGTLTYTPTPTPQPNTSARWNSWAGPCAGQSFAPPPAVPSTTGANNGTSSSSPGLPTVVLIAAALGAAASVAYLLNTLGKGNK